MIIDKNFIKLFANVTEKAACAASHFIGKNDKIAADQAAVDAMRNQLNKINMRGNIVVGEGEMDKAPMLFVDEKVGNQDGDQYDIAVDPLEGTNFTAKNLPNALSVLAASRKNKLLKAPDIYMEKIAVGSDLPDNLIDLDYGTKKNIERLCEAKNTTPDKITACVLKRPRHNDIIKVLNSMKVNINFISDGDVSGVISVAFKKLKNDIYLGIGGGPEGVLAAAALDCLGCQMQTRLVFNDKNEESKAKKLGILDIKKKYNIKDMVKDDVIFCATGVTDGELVKGVLIESNHYKTETFVLHKGSSTNKVIKNTINK